MSETPEQSRQLLGCGFAPLPSAHLVALRTIPQPEGYRGTVRELPDGSKTDSPTECPGYLTSLPEVIEIARARFHWKAGGLSSIGVTDWSRDPIAIGIEILEGAHNESDRWSYDNPVRK